MAKTFPTTFSFTTCSLEVLNIILQKMPDRVRIVEAGKGIVILPDTGGEATDSELIKALHLREVEFETISDNKEKFLLTDDWSHAEAHLLLTDDQARTIRWLINEGWLGEDAQMTRLGNFEFCEI